MMAFLEIGVPQKMNGCPLVSFQNNPRKGTKPNSANGRPKRVCLFVAETPKMGWLETPEGHKTQFWVVQVLAQTDTPSHD